MAQQPPIKIKRPQLVFSSWGSGPWLPAAIMDLKQTYLMWDVLHACEKNRTPVHFHRIRETVLFPTEPIDWTISGVFSQHKRITEHTIDLNHTICNQKHHIFAAVHFWNFWKQYVFPNPVSLQYLHGYISSTVANFSLQFVLESLLVHFP